VKKLKEILDSVGLEPERVEMFNLSSAMGAQFAETAKSMVAQIQDLGPSPLRLAVEEKADA
jgi:F420-non-reducing hydrogenase iron-sulfur subunit